MAYTPGMAKNGSSNRSAIAALVYAVGKKKNCPQYEATRQYLLRNLMHKETGYPFYYRYYEAQALFQADNAAWDEWNRETIQDLVAIQRKDGSFRSEGHLARFGPGYSTSMALLALALNYRFLPIYER